MKRIFSSLLAFCLVLALFGGLSTALAEGEDASVFSTSYKVTKYDIGINGRSLKKGASADITVYISRIAGVNAPVKVVRGLDSFSGGSSIAQSGITASDGDVSYDYKFTISGLKYGGEGKTLAFTVFYDSGDTQDFAITIRECVEYVETPASSFEDDTPEIIPSPRAVFHVSGLSAPISAGQSAVLTVTVKNVGTTMMRDPILTVTPSSSLMLTGGSSAFSLDNIGADKTQSVSVGIKALSEIDSQNQSLSCELSFAYSDGSSTASGTASGTLTIPAALSEEKKEEETDEIAAPVPRLILAGYNCGGSVEAGAKQSVSFAFLNTSRTTAIENVLLTISSGSDLAISGSTNTFYFDTIEAGGARSINVPFKAAAVLTSSAQDVRLSFTYEYIDQKTRKGDSAELTVSIPLYQPDRFVISEPKVASVGYVGDQNTITLDYINKGKSGVYNLEAFLSGDVDTTTPNVTVGNLESGKSGTIAFAVCPYNEGSNSVVITVTYEDANGETKEQIFETSVEAMAFEPYDPGEFEEPIEEPTKTFPWWIVGIVCAIITIVIGIVLRKKKKKARLAAEAAMWDEWDDDKPAQTAAPAQAAESAAAEVKK